jgi:hypothetical protein
VGQNQGLIPFNESLHRISVIQQRLKQRWELQSFKHRWENLEGHPARMGNRRDSSGHNQDFPNSELIDLLIELSKAG